MYFIIRFLYLCDATARTCGLESQLKASHLARSRGLRHPRIKLVPRRISLVHTIIDNGCANDRTAGTHPSSIRVIGVLPNGLGQGRMEQFETMLSNPSLVGPNKTISVMLKILLLRLT